MAKIDQLPSFSKIIFGTLLLAFGLAALAMSYQALVKGTEWRSKAAETEVTVKRWDFNGSAENWLTNYPTRLIIENGTLVAINSNQRKLEPGMPRQGDFGITLFNNAVNASLSLGNKYLKLRVRVSNPTSRPEALGEAVEVNTSQVVNCRKREPCLDDPNKPCRIFALLPGWCPPPPTPRPTPSCVPLPRCAYEGQTDGRGQTIYCTLSSLPSGSTYCPRPTPTSTKRPTPLPPSQFSATAIYTLPAGSSVKIGSLTGIADGQYKDYTLRLNEIAATNIAGVRLDFSGLQPNARVQIDWIALTGMKPPTPTPTRVCKTGVNSFGVRTPCSNDYRTAKLASFECYDGYKGTVGDGVNCKLVDELSAQTQTICKGRSSCPTSPAPTPPGCYYQQVQCFKAPCNPVLVCPTPTPPPSSTSSPPSPTKYIPIYRAF